MNNLQNLLLGMMGGAGGVINTSLLGSGAGLGQEAKTDKVEKEGKVESSIKETNVEIEGKVEQSTITEVLPKKKDDACPIIGTGTNTENEQNQTNQLNQDIKQQTPLPIATMSETKHSSNNLEKFNSDLQLITSVTKKESVSVTDIITECLIGLNKENSTNDKVTEIPTNESLTHKNSENYNLVKSNSSINNSTNFNETSNETIKNKNNTTDHNHDKKETKKDKSFSLAEIFKNPDLLKTSFFHKKIPDRIEEIKDRTIDNFANNDFNDINKLDPYRLKNRGFNNFSFGPPITNIPDTNNIPNNQSVNINVINPPIINANKPEDKTIRKQSFPDDITTAFFTGKDKIECNYY